MNAITHPDPAEKVRLNQVLPLQHFEFTVLNSVSNSDESYSAAISRSLSEKLGRHVSIAQVFVALERLEDKGYVSSQNRRPEPAVGGRRRRVFYIEASGKRALELTTATYRMSPPEIFHEQEKEGPLPA